MADQDANKTARASEDGSDLHRLRDIVVEEVSLVDRAANKRRFLVVKRSDGMSGDNGESGVEKAKKKPAPEDDTTDEQKAKKKPAVDEEQVDEAKAKKPPQDDEADDAVKAKSEAADETDEEAKPKRKSDLALPGDLKESLLTTLTQAMERLMALANQIKDAGEPDAEADDASLPDDLGSEIDAIAELLGEATAKSRKRKASKVDAAAGGARAPAAGAAEAKVAKGSRMAKDRLDRFQKAMALLSDILKEITQSNEEPAAPTAGAAEAGVQKRGPQAASPAVPGLKELAAGIGELTRVVKHQEEELARLRQARGVSNAIPVDGGGRRVEPQEVSWPLDMNRPISRDKVKKEVSFFDE